MSNLFKSLLKKGSVVITSQEIYDIYPKQNKNTVQAKIKRCLKRGDLKRLYKGVYALNFEYFKKSIFEERVAQAIDEESFLSGLGALRYHNLIPEVVSYKTFFGTKSVQVNQGNIHFEIKRLAHDQIGFGVGTIPVAGMNMRVATPVRAMMDILIEQKLEPRNRHQICAFFRIDDDDMEKIDWSSATSYAYKYRNNKLAKSIAAAMLNKDTRV